MSNLLNKSSESQAWHLLVAAAKEAIEAKGFKLERVPGRGLSNVWTARRNGEKKRLCIRTTRDRYVAFAPLVDGSKWKTLDDAELVAMAAVDSRAQPRN